jgi:hypothetical protein
VQPDPDNVGGYLISARSFAEYRAMFALADSDLSGAVPDCPGGASSFTAGANQAGASAIAADPVYARPRHSLAALATAEVERGSAHTVASTSYQFLRPGMTFYQFRCHISGYYGRQIDRN